MVIFDCVWYHALLPNTLHMSVADYTDDEAIISINNDPPIAFKNLQNHLVNAERKLNKAPHKRKDQGDLYPTSPHKYVTVSSFLISLVVSYVLTQKKRYILDKDE
ncbi:Reverse transcriptase domain-containing protein [Aphis craccivora]|uniref:Reverse transcriptase domain-containing protein n=1 Tax=Aphis craccivora TaxID=307492 RepID=A0A6G0YQT9_APHCR|nr:Reverse transcriptase domain-containing protein [Aphis craccivora]